MLAAANTAIIYPTKVITNAPAIVKSCGRPFGNILTVGYTVYPVKIRT